MKPHHRMILALSVLFLFSMPAMFESTSLAQPGQDDVAQTPPETTEPSAPQPREGFNSPRSTMFTFLDAMGRYQQEESEDALDDALACLMLADGTERERSRSVSIKLMGIINRLGKVSRAQLPSATQVESESIDSFSYYPRNQRLTPRAPVLPPWFQQGDFVFFTPVYERYPDGEIEFAVDKTTGEWRFATDTVRGIDDFYDATEPLDILYGADERELDAGLRLRSRIPVALREGEVLTVEYWQWIAIFVFTLLGVVLDFVIRFFLRTIASRVITRRGRTVQTQTLKRTVRPFGMVAAALLWSWALHLLDLPDEALKILLIAVKFFTMVAGVWAAYRLTDLGTELIGHRAEATTTKFDDLLVPLVRKTLKVFITVFGLIYIADALQIEILPLLTGLGIGGLAVGLAAKDTIENFFGSIAVIADRPFEVGDWVVINDVEGTVEELGFRSTRIRTFYNSLVTVPNATLVRAVVDNYGVRKYRRFKTHLGITYDTPPDVVEVFCEGIREIIRLHPYTRKDYYQVWMHQMSESSLDILVYMFHEAPDWQTELRERHRFLLDVMRLARTLGIDFAFPTQSLHLNPEPPPAAQRQREGGETAHTRASAQEEGRKLVQELTADAEWRRGKPAPYTFDICAVAHPDDETQIESKIGGDG